VVTPLGGGVELPRRAAGVEKRKIQN